MMSKEEKKPSKLGKVILYTLGIPALIALGAAGGAYYVRSNTYVKHQDIDGNASADIIVVTPFYKDAYFNNNNGNYLSIDQIEERQNMDLKVKQEKNRSDLENNVNALN